MDFLRFRHKSYGLKGLKFILEVISGGPGNCPGRQPTRRWIMRIFGFFYIDHIINSDKFKIR